VTNIVLLVRDRYRLTKQTLDTLRANTDPETYNLTIVDDGSMDFRVRRLILRECDRPGTTAVTVLNSKHVLADLKNIGVMWSGMTFGRDESGWLYLSDNDVYFLPDWLDRLTQAARMTGKHGFAIWSGQAHPYHLPTGFSVSTGDNGPIVREYQSLAGTSWLMPWHLWDEFGPLIGTAPGVCQSEDVTFIERVRQSGKMAGVPDPQVLLDCGITQSDGKPSPGAELKLKLDGVYYE
jgi:hypothetical protein